MKDYERDILRKNLLEFLKKESIHYTDLEKKVCGTSLVFATTNTFKSQLNYLLTNKYINRVTRGIYQITPKGEKYLGLLSS